jgi:predicted Zn-dependent protease
MKSEYCRLERSCTRFISRDESIQSFAERGSVQSARGGIQLFGGPPPKVWGDRLPAPRHSRDLSEAEDVLRSLRKRHRHRASLHYTSVSAHRVRIDPDAPDAIRTSEVWSLVGALHSPVAGHSIPVGWSGRGDGLDRIRGQVGVELERDAEMLGRTRGAESGVFDVVLAPPAAAVLVHEAVGHVVEAEAYRVPRALPVRIASESISATDHALEAGGAAHYEYDDESIRCLGPLVVVREGILVAELHSRESARVAGMLPTGNGRSNSVWDKALPRFSNLVCSQGDVPEQALIDRIRRGLYIRRLANGVYNGASVEATISLAEWICNGKLTQRYISCARINEDRRVLLRAEAAADNVAFYGNSLCGKGGQLLFDVGTAAPSLLVRAVRVSA